MYIHVHGLVAGDRESSLDLRIHQVYIILVNHGNYGNSGNNGISNLQIPLEQAGFKLRPWPPHFQSLEALKTTITFQNVPINWAARRDLSRNSSSAAHPEKLQTRRVEHAGALATVTREETTWKINGEQREGSKKLGGITGGATDSRPHPLRTHLGAMKTQGLPRAPAPRPST